MTMKRFTESYLNHVVERMVDRRVTRPINSPLTGPPTKEERDNHDLKVQASKNSYKQMIKYSLSNIGRELSHEFLFKLHSIALRDSYSDFVGQYKEKENFVYFYEEEKRGTAKPEEVFLLMSKWIGNQNEVLKTDVSLQEFSRKVAQSHILFEKIHPFFDGNGRVGRAVVSFMFLSKGYFPIVITTENKDMYNHYIDRDNSISLSNMFLSCLEEEKFFYQKIKNEEASK